MHGGGRSGSGFLMYRSSSFFEADLGKDHVMHPLQEDVFVFHFHDVAVAQRDDVEGEGAGEVGVDFLDFDPTFFDLAEDFLGVLDVHEVFEDFASRFVEDDEVVADAADGADQQAAAHLLSADAFFTAAVVAEDHKGAGRAMPEPALKHFGFVEGVLHDSAEFVAFKEVERPQDLEGVGGGDVKAVVGNADLGVVVLEFADDEAEGAAKDIVDPPTIEGVKEDVFPVVFGVVFNDDFPRGGDLGVLVLLVKVFVEAVGTVFVNVQVGVDEV